MLHASNDLQTSHRFMLGLPLLAAGLFCFSFILMHTHDTTSTAVNTRAVKTETSPPTTSSLSTSTPNPTQTPANQVTTQPDNLSSTSPKSTANLQSAGNPASLQQAMPNQASVSESDNSLPMMRHQPNKPKLLQPLKLLKNGRD